MSAKKPQARSWILAAIGFCMGWFLSSSEKTGLLFVLGQPVSVFLALFLVFTQKYEPAKKMAAYGVPLLFGWWVFYAWFIIQGIYYWSTIPDHGYGNLVLPDPVPTSTL